jgi:hypothetical protein
MEDRAMGRSIFWMAALLGAAIAVPYAADKWSKLKASGDSKQADGMIGARTSTTASFAESGRATTADLHSGAASSSDMPLVDMDQAFRLDLAPATVMSRWPRVSAGLPDEKLYGMRVALITGLHEDDLAGSLTYYFTPAQHCAKLTFIGSTGDPTRFIKLMTSRFGFKPFTSGEPGVMRYEIRWNGSAQSELVIRSAAIVRSSSPLTRYQVQVTVQDPAAR